MPLKRLKPIRDLESYHEPLFHEIDYHLYDLIYRPLLEVLKDETGLKVNDKRSTIEALSSGKIQYVDGYFYGEFNASVAKYLRQAGASFVKQKRAYKLPLDAMPQELRLSVEVSKAKTTAIIHKLNMQLLEIEKQSNDLDMPLAFKEPFEKTVKGLDKQFGETVVPQLGIHPEISEDMKERLTEDYSRNLDLYIKKWRKEAIFRLRDQIEENTLEGFRSTRMIERIKSEYGVSKNKARFLARQETSLLVSKYRKERYRDAGLEKYQWSTSGDGRVREDHRELNGKIFYWDRPPITDQATGARNNPGEDFQCRCVAIPIFEEAWEKDLAMRG